MQILLMDWSVTNREFTLAVLALFALACHAVAHFTVPTATFAYNSLRPCDPLVHTRNNLAPLPIFLCPSSSRHRFSCRQLFFCWRYSPSHPPGTAHATGTEELLPSLRRTYPGSAFGVVLAPSLVLFPRKTPTCDCSLAIRPVRSHMRWALRESPWR